ncbi:MAG: PriCT-2 domain-containing protein [Paludibacter sp.]
MSKKTFNPADWTETNKTKFKKNVATSPSGIPAESDIETITQRIESSSVDIAPNYADWRDLGFALADELGESGRAYYHRLSRFYQDYNSMETDKQYNACVKAHGHGVSIKTFYHLAKSAGVNVGIPKVKDSKPNSKVEDKAEIAEMSDEELSPDLSLSPLGEGWGEVGEGSGVRCFPPKSLTNYPIYFVGLQLKALHPRTKIFCCSALLFP